MSGQQWDVAWEWIPGNLWGGPSRSHHWEIEAREQPCLEAYLWQGNHSLHTELVVEDAQDGMERVEQKRLHLLLVSCGQQPQAWEMRHTLYVLAAI